MKCPKCNKDLIVIERQGIELDHCLTCKGFWFDEGEFDLLPDALKIDMTLPDFSAYPQIQTGECSYGCPRCRKKMDKITLGAGSALILDRCPGGDGLWFDAGELAQVVGKQVFVTAGTESHVVRFLGEVFSLSK